MRRRCTCSTMWVGARRMKLRHPKCPVHSPPEQVLPRAEGRIVEPTLLLVCADQPDPHYLPWPPELKDRLPLCFACGKPTTIHDPDTFCVADVWNHAMTRFEQEGYRP